MLLLLHAGTIVLWLYWPSFNAALKVGDQRHRAVINTYYSLSACAVVTFCLGSLFSKKQKIDMVGLSRAKPFVQVSMQVPFHT